MMEKENLSILQMHYRTWSVMLLLFSSLLVTDVLLLSADATTVKRPKGKGGTVGVHNGGHHSMITIVALLITILWALLPT